MNKFEFHCTTIITNFLITYFTIPKLCNPIGFLFVLIITLLVSEFYIFLLEKIKILINNYKKKN
jgi:hypothetical protein